MIQAKTASRKYKTKVVLDTVKLQQKKKKSTATKIISKYISNNLKKTIEDLIQENCRRADAVAVHRTLCHLVEGGGNATEPVSLRQLPPVDDRRLLHELSRGYRSGALRHGLQ